MSSTQTNFFIVAGDLPSISKCLRDHEILFIKVPALSKQHIISDDISTIGKNESYQVYLTRKEYEKNIFLHHQKDGFVVDLSKSYAIEFSRGGIYPYSDKVMHRSRLYTVKSYDEGKDRITKDEDFLKWVESIYKLFRRTFLKKSYFDKDILFSDHAINWMSENKAKVDSAGLIAS